MKKLLLLITISFLLVGCKGKKEDNSQWIGHNIPPRPAISRDSFNLIENTMGIIDTGTFIQATDGTKSVNVGVSYQFSREYLNWAKHFNSPNKNEPKRYRALQHTDDSILMTTGGGIYLLDSSATSGTISLDWSNARIGDSIVYNFLDSFHSSSVYQFENKGLHYNTVANEKGELLLKQCVETDSLIIIDTIGAIKVLLKVIQDQSKEYRNRWQTYNSSENGVYIKQ